MTDLSTPEKAWGQLLKSLQSGNERDIRAVSTEEGFSSMFPPDEMAGIVLDAAGKTGSYKDFGKYLATGTPKWGDKGSSKVAALAANEKEHMPAVTLEFIQTPQGWKVNRYTEQE